MTFPLTKTLEPEDYIELSEELTVVDQHFTKGSAQHPARRWEYAMALRAHDTWASQADIGGVIYDVGGAGSPFYHMLDPYQAQVIDPQESHGQSLASVLCDNGPRLGAAVFCLSVLEHVPTMEVDRFVYHLSCLVAPGGLLFLTMDLAGSEGSDIYHFHWMRERILTPLGHHALRRHFADLHLEPFGEIDAPGVDPIVFHGPQVYDYTFASLALRKRA